MEKLWVIICENDLILNTFGTQIFTSKAAAEKHATGIFGKDAEYDWDPAGLSNVGDDSDIYVCEMCRIKKDHKVIARIESRRPIRLDDV